MSTDQNINWITNFLWGIADDVLRDLYVRGKYRDVILPMVVLSVAARSRAQALLGADAEAAEAIIQNLIMVEGILAIVGGIAAIRLARFVAESVSAPLKELEAAMAQVAEGRLDARCAVVSNDEIGAVAEGFNRMVAGLREREVIRETFGRYVSPEVRDEILADGADLYKGDKAWLVVSLIEDSTRLDSEIAKKYLTPEQIQFASKVVKGTARITIKAPF